MADNFCNVYLALIHFPVYNKNEEIISTSVTNLDIHDIARLARTYGLRQYFIVHPALKQQQLVQSVLDFWRLGYGASYNPDRSQALDLITIADSLLDVTKRIEAAEGVRPIIVSTGAKSSASSVSYPALRHQIANSRRPFLLLFGTGWGLPASIMAESTFIVEPIYGVSDFNHLAVRSAAAIILDRLLGSSWWDGSLSC